MALRVRVQLEGRARWHDLEGSELTVGSGAACDVLIPHPSVAPCHARIFARRGRLMVVDAGSPRGTTVRGRRVHAPVVLEEQALLGIGEAAVSVSLLSETEVQVPRSLPEWGPLQVEVDATGRECRRFQLDGGLELSLATTSGSDWPTSLEVPSGAHIADIVGRGRWRNRGFIVERIGDGVTFESLAVAHGHGGLDVPRAVRALVYAQIVAAVGRWHQQGRVHGDVSSAAVRLLTSGRVLLLSPGPRARARFEDDLEALEGIRRALNLEGSRPNASEVDAAAIRQSVLDAARDGSDPSMASLARLARVLKTWKPLERRTAYL